VPVLPQAHRQFRYNRCRTASRAAWNRGTRHDKTFLLPMASQGQPSNQDWVVLWRTSWTQGSASSRLLHESGTWLPAMSSAAGFDPTERLYQKNWSRYVFSILEPCRLPATPLMKFDYCSDLRLSGIPASAERATVECTAFTFRPYGQSAVHRLSSSTLGNRLCRNRIPNWSQLQAGQ
jgi:hypothetical protein